MFCILLGVSLYVIQFQPYNAISPSFCCKIKKTPRAGNRISRTEDNREIPILYAKYKKYITPVFCNFSFIYCFLWKREKTEFLPLVFFRYLLVFEVKQKRTNPMFKVFFGMDGDAFIISLALFTIGLDNFDCSTSIQQFFLQHGKRGHNDGRLLWRKNVLEL
jgi:hypothetical protein